MDIHIPRQDISLTMFQKSFSLLVAAIAIMLPMENYAESLRSLSSMARSLSNELIAGYEPASIVTDHVSFMLDISSLSTDILERS